jgi:protein-L-isoaspartate O-methyltransferase
MVSICSLKRRLREHPVSRDAYSFAAERWLRLRIACIERTGGRYYSAGRLDRMYADSPDPWAYVGDPLSDERRRLTLEALPRSRYRRLLEVGCAEGWMTELLAERADEVVSFDISAVALERARRRCERFSHVSFLRLDVLEQVPGGPFDAIVCCGILVMLPEWSQVRVRESLVATLQTGGDLVLENLTDRYPGQLAGEWVEAGFRQHPQLNLLGHRRVTDYGISVFRRT